MLYAQYDKFITQKGYFLFITVALKTILVSYSPPALS